MAVPTLVPVALTAPDDANPKPLLVLGPSLGTAVRTLWSEVAELLADRYDVIGWELPGHGLGTAVKESFTLSELAEGVLAAVDAQLTARGEPGGTFLYAGDSIGGAVGLQLAHQSGHRVAAVAMLCSSARFGEEQAWRDRAQSVRTSGTPVMIAGSAERWFAPGFLERRGEVGGALLNDLQHADAESYALVSEALAVYDLREQLAAIGVPLLVVSGELDGAAPPSDGRLIATGVADGRLVVLPGVGHQAPVEAAKETADLLEQFFGQVATQHQVYRAGMTVRRQVLGDAHVDRATDNADETTREFQDFITRYAWGTIWTRPGLDRRSRSMITLTALVAGHHWEELGMHVRAALRNGLTREEIKEVLLQAAIYCSVPSANSAFRVAQQVFTEVDETGL